MKTKNGNKLEKPGGRYCNMRDKKCKEYDKATIDEGGYICLYCGGRVSKWLPVVGALSNINI